ncbi:MAG: hypothetical protein GF308_08620 [Candidatus Heimdallarchaeota archaeon]|nr:hypothetical protein [Candidatus Heimdallarchaeota archaeon]
MTSNKHNILQLRKNGLSMDEYIKKLSGKSGQEIKENIQKYEPKETILNRLAEKMEGYTVVVFSATWCKDCKINVAAFIKILQKQSSIEAIFFSDIKSAPLDPNIRWKVPPSPPEVNDFNLEKIPTFYILNSDGEVVATIVESPKHKDSLEEEFIYVLENA